MNQQVRFILFIAISVVILVGWQALFPAPKPPPKTPAVAAGADAGPTPGTPAPEGADAGAPAVTAEPAAPADGTPPPAGEATPDAPEELVKVETAAWVATFSTKGAVLKAFELQGEKQSRRADGEKRPMDLAQVPEGVPGQLALTLPPSDAFAVKSWRVAERGESAITFERRDGAITVRKTFRWEPSSYLLKLDVEVLREAGAPAGDVRLALATAMTGHPPAGGFFSSATQSADTVDAACHLAGAGRTVEKLPPGSEEKATPEGTPEWAGVQTRYFLFALAPGAPMNALTCALQSRPAAVHARLEAVVNPAPGAAQKLPFDLWIGPKDVKMLEAAGHELTTSIDFGFFTVICKLLLAIMNVFERFVGNWGIAIVLLTLLVKAITFPLTQKQMKSMEEMRRLAPKIEELKAKHAGDQNKINLETMKLYQEHKVQPLGGCVPMLVQMPVWFALYSALANSFELHNEPFIRGWIDDLTSQDPYYVLPVLMTVTMVLTQVLTPQPQQNAQMKYMTYGMPIFFGFIMLTLPAGLVLYIFTNNVLSIAQSLWFRRTHGAPQPAAG